MFESMSDSDLMLSVQLGNERAFAALYRRHYRALLDFFYAMSRNTQAAEDLCHETFLRLWRLRLRYQPIGSFRAYLFTIARNIWMESLRATMRDRRLGAVQPMEEIERLPGTDRLPDEAAQNAELMEQITTALDQLPDEQRMAFVLRTVQGLSLEEISSVMKCPLNTVRSRRLLAIRRLRDALRGILVL
jgi:RNA polymerase sigma-70 factor (ECF subfamily)